MTGNKGPNPGPKGAPSTPPQSPPKDKPEAGKDDKPKTKPGESPKKPETTKEKPRTFEGRLKEALGPYEGTALIASIAGFMKYYTESMGFLLNLNANDIAKWMNVPEWDTQAQLKKSRELEDIVRKKYKFNNFNAKAKLPDNLEKKLPNENPTEYVYRILSIPKPNVPKGERLNPTILLVHLKNNFPSLTYLMGKSKILEGINPKKPDQKPVFKVNDIAFFVKAGGGYTLGLIQDFQNGKIIIKSPERDDPIAMSPDKIHYLFHWETNDKDFPSVKRPKKKT